MILALFFITASARFSLNLEYKRIETSGSLGKDVRMFEVEHAVYAAEVYIGIPTKSFNLVVDLVRHGIWVELKDCENCAGFRNQYNPKSSTTYRYVNNQGGGSSFNSCSYYGYTASDFITINSFTAISSARFNITVANTDMKCSNYSVDGALGLTAYNSPFETLFIPYLKSIGEISSAVFALYVNNFSMTNKETYPKPSLEIGGYNLTHYSSDPSKLFFIESHPTSGHWAVNFDALRLGFWQAYGNISVSFSSTIRYVYGDLNEYINFLPFLTLYGLTCGSIPNYFIIKCLKNKKIPLPSFEFDYQTQKIILPNTTIWECEKDSCTLLIYFNRAGSWVFGQIFLETYFTIFNYDNSSIGFAPAAVSHIKSHDEDSSYSNLLCLSLLSLIFT